MLSMEILNPPTPLALRVTVTVRIKFTRVEEGRRENCMGMFSTNHFVSDNPNQF
ncbi:MAG: hypothetical protein F6K34_05750 [Okeania sp. SIO4D6]|nr:hypothetical protein [Okeania sp. SIO4D6]